MNPISTEGDADVSVQTVNPNAKTQAIDSQISNNTAETAQLQQQEQQQQTDEPVAFFPQDQQTSLSYAFLKLKSHVQRLMQLLGNDLLSIEHTVLFRMAEQSNCFAEKMASYERLHRMLLDELNRHGIAVEDNSIPPLQSSEKVVFRITYL